MTETRVKVYVVFYLVDKFGQIVPEEMGSFTEFTDIADARKERDRRNNDYQRMLAEQAGYPAGVWIVEREITTVDIPVE